MFAAGIVLFELVCARPLFHGKGKEALEMVKSGAIPRPKDFAPELPDSLERIILKALAFHRSDRYQTARDLYIDLHEYLKTISEAGTIGAVLGLWEEGLDQLAAGVGHPHRQREAVAVDVVRRWPDVSKADWRMP